MEIPREVIKKAFQECEESVDCGQGYSRVAWEVESYPCDCCGSYIDNVTILTPEGVEVKVEWVPSSQATNWEPQWHYTTPDGVERKMRTS